MEEFFSKSVLLLVELTDGDRGADSRPEAEAGEQRPVEVCVNAADLLGLSVRDAVESQLSGLLVHIHSHTPGFRTRQSRLSPSMPQGEGLAGPVQAPGVCVVAQSGTVLG